MLQAYIICCRGLNKYGDLIMKKFIAVLLSVVVLASMLCVYSGAFEIERPEVEFDNPSVKYAPGDVNGDGKVNSDDLTKHARYVGGIITDWDQD